MHVYSTPNALTNVLRTRSALFVFRCGAQARHTEALRSRVTLL